MTVKGNRHGPTISPMWDTSQSGPVLVPVPRPVLKEKAKPDWRPHRPVQSRIGGVAAAGLRIVAIDADWLHLVLCLGQRDVESLLGDAGVFSLPDKQETIQLVDVDRGIACCTLDHLEEGDGLFRKRERAVETEGSNRKQ